jgi:hypothetical protein
MPDEVVGATAAVFNHTKLGLHPVHTVDRLRVAEVALLILVTIGGDFEDAP